VVLHRQNAKQWLAIVRLDDLKALAAILTRVALDMPTSLCPEIADDSDRA